MIARMGSLSAKTCQTATLPFLTTARQEAGVFRAARVDRLFESEDYLDRIGHCFALQPNIVKQ